MTRAVVCLGIAATLGCARNGAEGPTAKDDGPTKDTDSTLDTTGEVPEIPGDRCGDPITAAIGSFVVTLHDAASDLDGACGLGGPDVFARLGIARRADLRVSARGRGFVPRVGILGGCTHDWEGHTLGCSDGLPTTVLDMPAGSDVLLAIGIAADDPVLATADGDDDLLVEVQTSLRPVLSLGERCAEDRGRCETGTSCTPADDGVARCVAIAGDTCASAEVVVLTAGEPQSIAIDPAIVQTDAHAHGCIGARRPDRVLRLELPPSLPADSSLAITTDALEIGLAARGPGCLASDEIACAVPTAAGTALVVDDVGAVLGAGRTVFAFVELPAADAAVMGDGAGEQAPFVVELLLSGQG